MTRQAVARLLVCAAAAFASTGCNLERSQPGPVAMGVSRLTAVNAAALVSAVNTDTACGFASQEVLANPVIEHTLVNGKPVGELGTVTWEVKDCQMDFGTLHQLSMDCNRVITQIGGKARVSGRRIITGALTGNATNPVVPANADSVRLELSASFDNFVVSRAGAGGTLTNTDGTLTFTAEPHLAVSLTKGVCSIPTSDLTLRNLQYTNANVHLDSKEHTFDVAIATSDVTTQFGKWKGNENGLAGSMTVWDSEQKLPIQEDGKGVDPKYDAKTFADSYACTGDLALPVSYSCPSINAKLGYGAGQLTVNSFGNLALYLDEEPSCGFGSTAVTTYPEVKGTLGDPGGSATYRITKPCTLTFNTPTAVRTDCNGVSTYFMGSVTVTGSKTVKGIRTGSVVQPIIPTSRDAAELNLELSFNNFTVSDSLGKNALTVQSGTLSGKVLPRTALDWTTGACSLKTRVGTFSDLKYTDAKLSMKSDGLDFKTTVTTSNFSAQSGTGGSKVNFLGGTVTSNSELVQLPEAGIALDPNYDPISFTASYAACQPKMRVPQTDAECSFTQPLAEGVSRLLVQNVGAVTKALNNDGKCGFESNWVLLNPSSVSGDPGTMGSMGWRVSGCQIGKVGMETSITTCAGTRQFLSGAATIDAARMITGERYKKKVLGLPLIDAIIPRAPEAMKMNLTQVQLQEFSAYSIAKDATVPAGKLTLHTGTLLAEVAPLLGERASTPNVFDIGTPIAGFSNVELINATATLEAGGMTFNLAIPHASVNAFNGTYKGQSNVVGGTMTIGTNTVTVAPMALDPAFSQTAFDTSYACTEDLKQVLPFK